jgi:hypothetical protein
MCDGPVRYAGDSVKNLELLPPIVRSSASFSKVEMPYATYLLNQELNTYMNMGMRILTARDLERLRKPDVKDLMDPSLIQIANKELQTLVLPDTVVPEMITPVEKIEATPEDLRQLGVAQPEAEAPLPQEEQPQQQSQPQGMPVNVVLQNTMQPQMQPQVFNYNVVGEAQPSSSIEADDLSAFPLQMPPQMQQQPSVNINIQPQQQQPQTNAVLVPSAIPGAPPTLVVDTSGPAMQATGLPPLPMQQPRQQNNVNRRTPPRSVSQPQVNNGPSVAASTVPPATKVNVIKQG